MSGPGAPAFEDPHSGCELTRDTFSAWMPNTDLRPLGADDVKMPDKLKGSKKGLAKAYEVASQFHSLDYFKKIINEFELARAEEEREWLESVAAEEAKAAKQAEDDKKAEQKEKKSKRRSTAAADTDVEMGEEEAPAPKSSSKKRKASAAVDDGEEKVRVLRTTVAQLHCLLTFSKSQQRLQRSSSMPPRLPMATLQSPQRPSQRRPRPNPPRKSPRSPRPS